MDYISRSNTPYNNDVWNDYNRYNTCYRDRSYSTIYDDFGDSNGITFFFKQIEKHYNLLNERVFEPLYTINNIETGFGLLNSFKLNLSFPPDSIYKVAKLHIKKDCPELIEKRCCEML